MISRGTEFRLLTSSWETSNNHPAFAGWRQERKKVVEWFERIQSPENSWLVTEDEKGKLMWTSADDTRHKEKARGGGQKFKTRLAGAFTSKKQL